MHLDLVRCEFFKNLCCLPHHFSSSDWLDLLHCSAYITVTAFRISLVYFIIFPFSDGSLWISITETRLLLFVLKPKWLSAHFSLNCSIGNFFFAGARIFFQSLDAAIFLFSRVSQIPTESLVLPVISTNDRLTLGCELWVWISNLLLEYVSLIRQ